MLMMLADEDRPGNRKVALGGVWIEAIAREQTRLGNAAVSRFEHQQFVRNSRDRMLDVVWMQPDMYTSIDLFQQTTRRSLHARTAKNNIKA